MPVVYVRAALMVVWPLASVTLAQAEPTWTSGEIQAIYVNHCVDCHESDGRGHEYRHSGISIPDFTSLSWMRARSATQLKLSIQLGKGEEMPPFEGEISGDETVALVRFIRAMAGLPADGVAGSPSKVEFDRELAELNREWDRLSIQWNRVFAEFETALVSSPVRSHAGKLRDVK